MSYLPPHMRNGTGCSNSNSNINSRIYGSMSSMSSTSNNAVSITRMRPNSIVIPPQDPTKLTNSTRANIGFWSQFNKDSLDGIGKKLRKKKPVAELSPEEAEKEAYRHYVEIVQDEISNKGSEHDGELDEMIADNNDW